MKYETPMLLLVGAASAVVLGCQLAIKVDRFPSVTFARAPTPKAN